MTNRRSTTRNLPGNLKASSNRGRATSLEDIEETETELWIEQQLCRT
jgi:hypothetical protein